MKKLAIILVSLALALSVITVHACNLVNFDTSALVGWCSDDTNSTIRMMGGEKYDDKGIVTEDGNIWDWDGKVEDGDFLLVWIDDNGTPNNVKDDIVVKVWREVI